MAEKAPIRARPPSPSSALHGGREAEHQVPRDGDQRLGGADLEHQIVECEVQHWGLWGGVGQREDVVHDAGVEGFEGREGGGEGRAMVEVERCPSQPLGRRRRGVRGARMDGGGEAGLLVGAETVVAGRRDRDRDRNTVR